VFPHTKRSFNNRRWQCVLVDAAIEKTEESGHRMEQCTVRRGGRQVFPCKVSSNSNCCNEFSMNVSVIKIVVLNHIIEK